MVQNAASKLALWYDGAPLQGACGCSTPLSPVGTASPLSNSISLPTASLQEQAVSETSAPHLHRCLPPTLTLTFLATHRNEDRALPLCVVLWFVDVRTHHSEIRYLEECWTCSLVNTAGYLIEEYQNDVRCVTFCLLVCLMVWPHISCFRSKLLIVCRSLLMRSIFLKSNSICAILEILHHEWNGQFCLNLYV